MDVSCATYDVLWKIVLIKSVLASDSKQIR